MSQLLCLIEPDVTAMFFFSGTERSDQWPCPIGTFNNMTGLNQSTDCTACSGGYYCGIVGQSAPTAQCDAGYYCKRYAEMSSPNQTSNADICPQGQ